MLKSVLFSICFSVVFIFGWLSEDVSVTQDHPERVDALSEFDVNITIHKSAIKGFAKYQQTMPEGVEITNLEGQGATFTFSDQTIKYIWMSLPESENYTISYHVKIKDASLSSIIMGGKFSYLDDNQRMSYNIPTKEIKVGEELIPEEIIPEPVVSISRTIKETDKLQYLVDITVDKKNINGFAKVQDFIPSGAQVESEETAGAVFSVVDRKAKFVWLNIPNSQVFNISYSIDLTDADPKDMAAVFGEFSFLHNGKTQTEKINAIGFEDETLAVESSREENKNNASTSPIAAEEEKTEQIAQQTQEKEKSAPTEEEKVKKKDVSKKVLSSKTSTTNDEAKQEQKTTEKNATAEPAASKTIDEKKITSTPSPEKGVFYRVQLLAGKNNVKAPYFAEKHSYTANFFVENHQGWIKYTTGHHNVYKSARDSRESIKSQYNFPGPFVVAYNDGKRITVQEALMVTGQKWLQ